jgi:hypothetical protein
MQSAHLPAMRQKGGCCFAADAAGRADDQGFSLESLGSAHRHVPLRVVTPGT